MSDSEQSKLTKLSKVRTFAGDMKRLNDGGESDDASKKPAAARSIPPKPILPKSDTDEEKDDTDTKRKPVDDAVDTGKLKIIQPKKKPTSPIPAKPISPKKGADTGKAKPAAIPPRSANAEKTARKEPPSFHELEKAARESAKNLPPDKQVRVIQGENEYGDTTIISDKKKQRIDFITPIVESYESFKADLANLFKKGKKKTYEVPDTSRRKGIIQRATSQSGTSFTADYQRLRERLRLRAEGGELDDDEDLYWSPYTEAGYALLEPGEEDEGVEETPTISNVQVEPRKTASERSRSKSVEATDTPEPDTKPDQPAVKSKPKKTIPEPAIIEPTNQAPLVAAEPTVPEVAAEERAATSVTPDNTPSAEAEPTPQPTFEETAPEVPTPTPQPAAPAPQPTPVAEPTPAPVIEPDPEPVVPTEVPPEPPRAQPPAAPARSPRTAPDGPVLERFTTNTITLAAASALLAVVLLGFGISSLVGALNQSDTSTIPSDTFSGVTVLPLTALEYRVTNTETVFAFLRAEQANLGEDLTEVVLVQPNGDPWTPHQILRLVDAETSDPFNAALTDVRFIMSANEPPTILFRVGNQSAAQGGVRMWEDRMSQNLSTLWPNSGTGAFANRTINAVAGRSLISANGPTITYTLTDTGFLVIAPSPGNYADVMTVLSE